MRVYIVMLCTILHFIITYLAQYFSHFFFLYLYKDLRLRLFLVTSAIEKIFLSTTSVLVRMNNLKSILLENGAFYDSILSI